MSVINGRVWYSLNSQIQVYNHECMCVHTVLEQTQPIWRMWYKESDCGHFQGNNVTGHSDLGSDNWI